jgi:hypothetical protein
MEKTLPTEVRLHLSFNFWNKIKAQYFLLTQRLTTLLVFLAWPFSGVVTLVTMLLDGHKLSFYASSIIFIAIVIVPLSPALGVALNHRRNKQPSESFTYIFNESGVHCDTLSVQFTHPWSSITHVKKRWGFLFFFFAPDRAHCIPLSFINQASALEQLLNMAKAHNVTIK